jgi:hypothetical protein
MESQRTPKKSPGTNGSESPLNEVSGGIHTTELGGRHRPSVRDFRAMPFVSVTKFFSATAWSVCTKAEDLGTLGTLYPGVTIRRLSPIDLLNSLAKDLFTNLGAPKVQHEINFFGYLQVLKLSSWNAVASCGKVSIFTIKISQTYQLANVFNKAIGTRFTDHDDLATDAWRHALSWTHGFDIIH